MSDFVISIDVPIQGGIRGLESYGRRVQRDLQEVLDAYAFLIQRQAQLNAPVDTGYMRSGIIVISEGDWVRVIGASADYAHYVEFGTRYTEPQPFLVPAFLAYKRQFEQAVRQVLAG